MFTRTQRSHAKYTRNHTYFHIYIFEQFGKQPTVATVSFSSSIFIGCPLNDSNRQSSGASWQLKRRGRAGHPAQKCCWLSPSRSACSTISLNASSFLACLSVEWIRQVSSSVFHVLPACVQTLLVDQAWLRPYLKFWVLRISPYNTIAATTLNGEAMFAQEKSEEEKHKTAAAHFHMSGYGLGLLHSSIPGGMPVQSFWRVPTASSPQVLQLPTSAE